MTALAIQEPFNRAATPARSSRLGWASVLSFPPFRLDLVEERLWKGERELRLRPKPLAILRFLAQNPRRLVTRLEIVDAVWGRIAMSESLLRTHMHDLRRALGEAVIETVVGRGYRFVANMAALEDGATAPVSRAEASVGLSVVQGSDPAPLGRIHEATRLVASVDRARVLKQLADALESIGASATVVLVVGGMHGSSFVPSSSDHPEGREGGASNALAR